MNHWSTPAGSVQRDAEVLLHTCEQVTNLTKGKHIYDTAMVLRLCRAVLSATPSETATPYAYEYVDKEGVETFTFQPPDRLKDAHEYKCTPLYKAPVSATVANIPCQLCGVAEGEKCKLTDSVHQEKHPACPANRPDDKHGEAFVQFMNRTAAHRIVGEENMFTTGQMALAFRAGIASTASATRFSVREQIELVVEAGYDRDKVHPACYAGFSYSELFEAIAKRMQRQYVHGGSNA